MTEIWRAGPAEWQAYRDIRLASLADAPDAFASTLDGELRLSEQDWRGRLTNAATFLGSLGGKVMATATGLPQPDNEALLVGVWAHPDARGTGLAAAVIQAVLDWGKDRTRIRLDVADYNEPAKRLYTKLGFTPTGRTGSLPGKPHITEIELALTASADDRQP
jgi:RimJ/RimL family protein N-acetyltransferase